MFYYELCNFGFVWQNKTAGLGARETYQQKFYQLCRPPTPTQGRIIVKTFIFGENKYKYCE